MKGERSAIVLDRKNHNRSESSPRKVNRGQQWPVTPVLHHQGTLQANQTPTKSENSPPVTTYEEVEGATGSLKASKLLVVVGREKPFPTVQKGRWRNSTGPKSSVPEDPKTTEMTKMTDPNPCDTLIKERHLRQH